MSVRGLLVLTPPGRHGLGDSCRGQYSLEAQIIDDDGE